ncbi:MAG: hypothetical protein KTR18_16275 [Acidiferrobacterales bacterium]|nr:hypothetical protein [Acidiferrobacterales bacterium]
MNKSLLTNLVAAVIFAAGSYFSNPILLSVGLFALSGAVTNWLAVHMLFDKVPGLYGSGVVPAHFEELKSAIRELMMTQFFHQENIERFLAGDEEGVENAINLEPVIREMDLSPTFDGLVKTIEESSFGGMLSMIGGSAGLEALKQPFVTRMQTTLISLAGSPQVQTAIRSGLQGQGTSGNIGERITEIIDKRLDELTPEIVKSMIQDIIRAHLGWLVVWGGVFGGLIGLISSLLLS